MLCPAKKPTMVLVWYFLKHLGVLVISDVKQCVLATEKYLKT